MSIVKTYLHIRMNPKKVSGEEYNNEVRKYPLNKGYLFVLEFVHDVEHIEVEEVTVERYRELLNNAGVR